jgi:uncharacterized membrane protein
MHWTLPPSNNLDLPIMKNPRTFVILGWITMLLCLLLTFIFGLIAIYASNDLEIATYAFLSIGCVLLGLLVSNAVSKVERFIGRF